MTFTPDAEIFGARTVLDPDRLYAMSKAKAYLFGGVEIRWRCAPELIKDPAKPPVENVLKPNWNSIKKVIEILQKSHR